MEGVEALLDGLLVVVHSPGRLAAVQQTLGPGGRLRIRIVLSCCTMLYVGAYMVSSLSSK